MDDTVVVVGFNDGCIPFRCVMANDRGDQNPTNEEDDNGWNRGVRTGGTVVVVVVMGWDGSIVRIEPWIIIGTTESSPIVEEDMGATASVVFSFTRGDGDVVPSSTTTIVEKDEDDFEQVVPMVGL